MLQMANAANLVIRQLSADDENQLALKLVLIGNAHIGRG